MNIDRYDSGLLNSSMYVISEKAHALVIDPCLNLNMADQYTVDCILITHEHYDHIFGVNAWKSKTNAPLMCSEACAHMLKNPKKNQARHFDSFCELQSFSKEWDASLIDPEYTCKADIIFNNTVELSWQGHNIRLLEIPGHSPGSIGIWINDVFFSGDILLEGKEIELRLPGGSKKKWEEHGKSIIDSIPNGTMIYPGHFSSYKLKR